MGQREGETERREREGQRDRRTEGKEKAKSVHILG